MSPRPTLGVGLLGAGTVGREVARAFVEHPDRLARAGGQRLELLAVAVRNAAHLPSGVPPEIVTDAPAHVVADPRIDVIVELMGGDEPARTLIAAALAAGKAVVTANKHVLAHHGPELEAVARRADAALRFEASVGGGIPVLTPLGGQLASTRISRVRGIVNGTTNFMLDEMASEARSYHEALTDAQAAGYAEADPTADVEGLDAANKLVILARLAFGSWAPPGTVTRAPWTRTGTGKPGIVGISMPELSGAAALGLAIKLIADVRRLDDGRVGGSVLPTLVPDSDPMARIRGVRNRIEIRADPLGSIACTGPGAGGPATSSAVIGDILAVARGEGSTWGGLEPAPAASMDLAPPVEEGPDRGWFTFAPGLRDLAIDDAQIVRMPTADGVAIHARCGTLEQLRSLLASILPERIDVTIYPVDEQVTLAAPSS